MAIFRGTGGSVGGITDADILLISISQGGTGATTASGARTNLGLGTAATTDASAYATAAQGAKADTALQSFTETDPVFAASEAASITSTDTTNWDTAYTDRLKWDGGSTGLNASTARTSLGLATVASSGDYNDLSNKPTIPTNLDSLTDVVITSPTTNQTLQYNGTNWVNATGGGGSGTVTSVAMSVPTGLSVSGSPVTTSGTLAVTYAAGYSIPTTTKQTEWDTAYSWGNHASAGYVTSGGALGTPSSGNLANCTFPTLNQNTTGSAATLTTGRTIGMTGDMTWTSGSFNGSANVTGTGTLATVNSNVGSFGSSSAIPVVTVNAKGLVTAVSTATVAGGQYFGSAATKAIAYNSNNIAENVTVTTGNNGLSAGPITISSGFAVTVQSGSVWTIV